MPNSENNYRVQIESELEDLIPGFLKNRRNDVDKLKTMLSGNDFEALKLLGHTMKGNGAGYGFERISELGRQIEENAKEQNVQQISQLITDLSDYLHHVKVEFV